MPDTLLVVAALFTLVGLALIVTALAALRQRRPFRMSLRLLLALVFFAAGAALGAIGLGIQGYRALTHEEVAAVVRTEPRGPNRFEAHFHFADGRQMAYTLAGNQLYVDARILKWHPLANLLGLHTAYELDRVAGRYADLAEEQQQPRTVLSLAPEREMDLFRLRQRYALLEPLLDAEYGSATFAATDSPAQYEVRVSISGLLIRKVAP